MLSLTKELLGRLVECLLIVMALRCMSIFRIVLVGDDGSVYLRRVLNIQLLWVHDASDPQRVSPKRLTRLP